MPTKPPDAVEQKALAARAADRQGPDVLGPVLGVPPRTISRILRRRNVAYLRHCDPMTDQVIRTSKATAVRDRKAKVGYDYVHSLVDDHSRLAYSEILPAGPRPATSNTDMRFIPRAGRRPRARI